MVQLQVPLLPLMLFLELQGVKALAIPVAAASLQEIYAPAQSLYTRWAHREYFHEFQGCFHFLDLHWLLRVMQEEVVWQPALVQQEVKAVLVVLWVMNFLLR